ncbi:GH116 family glycosyl-hydrolase [Paenibacillus methanolicus]|uniref:Uncharacterized protein (DUF608 family) n=1 Tax=Paenibacillus methanolicus TaxID=582686 RepID=A0A5S5CBG3_9BACL|nr:GH116 family glycosyl-hydrolase [Paenibacillus methanolicus]TYP76721.1 uncharacterized protein (DUF608 family) [Paenibacillus methanolicus]
METMSKTYRGNQTREISFPLGGIGSGSIGLAGNGRLVDWEIFNSPNKRSFSGFSHIAVKAEADGKLMDARVLQGDYPAPYMGEPIRGGAMHSGYGFGPESNTLAGMAHFRQVEFEGAFPFAKLAFTDERFPGQVNLTAFNPFIPLNDKDSSIPCAMFEVELENPLPHPVTYTVAFTACNPKPTEQIVHAYHFAEGVHSLKLGSAQYAEDDPRFGDITLAVQEETVSYQEFWYRGGWFDNLEMYWRDFAKPGMLTNRNYLPEQPPQRHQDNATLAAHMELAQGERRKVRFVLSWNFPNVINHWNPEPAVQPTAWRNYYAGLFLDSLASAQYALREWERLEVATRDFQTALFSTTVPPVIMEAVSANLSVLKSAACLRLTDGSFYGFEGCIEDVGCCEGSCTHVWNYAYALPFLFPSLERSMRSLDFRYNYREGGSMAFRLMLPVGREPEPFRACVDGQMGGVIKAYRDWKISGDHDWLASHWDVIKQSIEYAWSEENPDGWDADKDGVLEGRQHHTLDMELFGPNAWLSGFYLAALKAGAEMAEHFGEAERAIEYRALFAKGKAWVDEHLFNGSYYTQRLDLSDRRVLEIYDNGESLAGDNAVADYWNEETGEIKYQIGDGCVIDQVIAQWHANLCGLGEIFDPAKTQAALRSLYADNFRSMRDEANAWRLFSLNDEAGLVICTWPEGTQRPAVPLTYASETMTGFEYQAASHMIQEGMIEEGVAIVSAIRDRYDGEKRNPWNEMECGSNYARSMASYSLLLSFSGFEYDLNRGMIGFAPVRAENGKFRTFWSIGSGWGVFEQHSSGAELQVLAGHLTLNVFKLPQLSGIDRCRAVYQGGEQSSVLLEGALIFPNPITIQAGQSLRVTWE